MAETVIEVQKREIVGKSASRGLRRAVLADHHPDQRVDGRGSVLGDYGVGGFRRLETRDWGLAIGKWKWVIGN